EDGTLQGWQIWDSGGIGSLDGVNAFSTQPTYGDNVIITRPAGNDYYRNQALSYLQNNIGGDYWKVGYPIGHQGKYWIGTYENRKTPSQPWGQVQGGGRTGRPASPIFTI